MHKNKLIECLKEMKEMKEYLIFTTIEDPSKLSELNCVCVPYKNVFVVIGGERD